MKQAYPIEVGQVRRSKGTGRYYIVVEKENSCVLINHQTTHLVEYLDDNKRYHKAKTNIENDKFMIRETNRRAKYGR